MRLHANLFWIRTAPGIRIAFLNGPKKLILAPTQDIFLFRCFRNRGGGPFLSLLLNSFLGLAIVFFIGCPCPGPWHGHEQSVDSPIARPKKGSNSKGNIMAPSKSNQVKWGLMWCMNIHKHIYICSYIYIYVCIYICSAIWIARRNLYLDLGFLVLTC